MRSYLLPSMIYLCYPVLVGSSVAQRFQICAFESVSAFVHLKSKVADDSLFQICGT